MPIEDRVREAVDAYVARVRHDLDAHAETFAADMRALAASDQPRRATDAGALERLLTAVRQIDDARSLTTVLDVLVRVVSVETSRVAVLLAAGDHLAVQNHRGFADGSGPTDVPVDASGGVAVAVATRRPLLVTATTNGHNDIVPAFLRLSDHAIGVAVPVVVGGDVVAVLWADDEGRDSSDAARTWTEVVELLARHASVCLEKITSVRTVELLVRPG